MGASTSLDTGRANRYCTVDEATDSTNSEVSRKISSAVNLEATAATIQAQSAAMDQITDYEKSLLPGLWRKALQNNCNFCENVYGRLFEMVPHAQQLYGVDQDDVSCAHHQLIKAHSAKLRLFIASVMTKSLSDTQAAAQMCAELGQKLANKTYHPPVSPKTSLQHTESNKLSRKTSAEKVTRAFSGALTTALRPFSATSRERSQSTSARVGAGNFPIKSDYWIAFTNAICKEFDASLDNSDTDERELQVLAWRRFVEGMVTAVADAYEHCYATKVRNLESAQSASKSFKE